MVVQWPAVIRKGGKITGQVCHVMDILLTSLDAAGVDYPKAYKGRQVGPADGKSMVPIFRDEQRDGHDVIFWKFAHGRAVRQGKWKLVAMDRREWELYDIESDPVELEDLSKKMPEKVEELDKLWRDWAGAQAGKKPGKKKKKSK
jgi:arylsulfatase